MLYIWMFECLFKWWIHEFISAFWWYIFECCWDVIM